MCYKPLESNFHTHMHIYMCMCLDSNQFLIPVLLNKTDINALGTVSNENKSMIMLDTPLSACQDDWFYISLTRAP